VSEQGGSVGRRPNVVLIITDQHRRDHTGFGGNPVVQTPQLDALAARAVDFSEAFVANPICMPNRATMLTGRMPSVHGTRCNGIALDWDAETFVRLLRNAGYRTGLVGKAHFQNMFQQNEEGEGRRTARRRRWPEGWNTLEDQERWRAGRVEMPDDFYGFEHVELAVGHADVVSGEYFHWLRDHDVDPATLLGPAPDRAFAGWWQVWRTRLPEELYPTAFVGERTSEFIRASATSGSPFFVQCSFPDPHHPFTPPGRYYDLYDPADVPLPATFDDDHATSVPHLKAWRSTRGDTPPEIPVMPFSPTEEIYREAAAKEYGAITMIDSAVGSVLDAIDEAGQADNTIVIFTSDHGEMFGDHGLMLKAAMHYRGALRVPLLVADPRRPAARCSSLVGTIDLAQTILDLTAVDRFSGMQGRSLVPLLDDPIAGLVHDAIVVEEDEPFDLAMTGSSLRMRTLITPTSRLSVYRGTERGELFDLDADPDELVNRFDDADAVGLRGELFEVLARELLILDDRDPAPTGLA